jgi:hypothetical protein
MITADDQPQVSVLDGNGAYAVGGGAEIVLNVTVAHASSQLSVRVNRPKDVSAVCGSGPTPMKPNYALLIATVRDAQDNVTWQGCMSDNRGKGALEEWDNIGVPTCPGDTTITFSGAGNTCDSWPFETAYNSWTDPFRLGDFCYSEY